MPTVRTPQARADELFPPGYDCLTYTHVMRDGVVFEDVLRHGYWAGCAKRFGLNTKENPFIRVVNDEHSILAELYVRSVQTNMVIVETVWGPLYFGDVKLREDYQPKWIVGKRAWRIMRMSDKQFVFDKEFGTKEQCQEYIDENLMKEAA